MPKPQKVEAVRELKERFEGSKAALLAEFRGLKVEEMKELRRILSESGGQFKVVKNTLSRIAAKEASLDELLPFLEGSTAIAFINGDPVAAAKGLDEMAKKYPALVIKGGLMDGKVFGAEQAQALAKVKPREVLLAQLAGLLQSPIQGLVNLLQAPVRDLGYVLAAYRQKLEEQGPASPAPETGTPPEAAVDSPEQAEKVQEPTGEGPSSTEGSPEETHVSTEATAVAADEVPEQAPASTEEAQSDNQDQQPTNGEG